MFDGTYDGYIWAAYAVCVVLLVALCGVSYWSLRAIRKQLAQQAQDEH